MPGEEDHHMTLMFKKQWNAEGRTDGYAAPGFQLKKNCIVRQYGNIQISSWHRTSIQVMELAPGHHKYDTAKNGCDQKKLTNKIM